MERSSKKQKLSDVRALARPKRGHLGTQVTDPPSMAAAGASIRVETLSMHTMDDGPHITSADGHLALPSDAGTDIPFQVVEVAPLKKAVNGTQPSPAKYPVRHYDCPYDKQLSLDYKVTNRRSKTAQRVLPWTKCPSYKIVKNRGHRYRVGDVVTVAHVATGKRQDKEELDEDDGHNDDWVARIVNVRGVYQEDIFSVYALVAWFYRPEDLRNGRPTWMSPHEVMPSSFLQIIHAAAITNHVELRPESSTICKTHKACEMSDDHVEKLIWRQTINYKTERFGNMLHPCGVCRQRVDFSVGSILICHSQQCGTAHHQDCVLNHAQKKWVEKQTVESLGAYTNQASESVKVPEQKKAVGETPPAPNSLLRRIIGGLYGRSLSNSPAASVNKPELIDPTRSPSGSSQVSPAHKEEIYDMAFQTNAECGAALGAEAVHDGSERKMEVSITCPSCRIIMTA